MRVYIPTHDDETVMNGAPERLRLEDRTDNSNGKNEIRGFLPVRLAMLAQGRNDGVCG